MKSNRQTPSPRTATRTTRRPAVQVVQRTTSNIKPPLTTAAAARALNISTGTLTRLAKNREINCVRFGRSFRFPYHSIRSLAHGEQVQVGGAA